MSLPPLTIVPAGAGSGKTYKLQQDLGTWIQKGEVSPERIVAVTFTNAAAAELSQRIRSRLIQDGRVEDALKLDQSYISTIHAFGQRLITEYAFDLGHSPTPRLLNGDEERILIRFALANSRRADEIASQYGAIWLPLQQSWWEKCRGIVSRAFLARTATVALHGPAKGCHGACRSRCQGVDSGPLWPCGGG